jgi:hypothetical protein
MKTDRIEIRIESEIKMVLQEQADKEDRTLSNLITEILKKHIKKLVVCLMLLSMVGCSHYMIVQDGYGPNSWGKSHAIACAIGKYEIKNANERFITVKDNIDNEINFIRVDKDGSTIVIFKGIVSGQYSESDISKIIHDHRDFVYDYMQ